MGITNKASSFLKECMADALLRLMRTKDIAKITVNEIANAAGVHRSTWFRSFNAKNEALTFKLIILWRQWSHEHGMGNDQIYAAQNVSEFFAFNAANKKLIKQLFDAGQEAAVYEAFYKIISPQREASEVECYQNRFYSYGLFGLLREWYRRDFQDSPEHMTAMFLQIAGLSKQNAEKNQLVSAGE